MIKWQDGVLPSDITQNSVDLGVLSKKDQLDEKEGQKRVGKIIPS